MAEDLKSIWTGVPGGEIMNKPKAQRNADDEVVFCGGFAGKSDRHLLAAQAALEEALIEKAKHAA